MNNLNLPEPLGRFAQAQTLELRNHLLKELKSAAKTPHAEDSIHDLRVAIRRFVQCLRLFKSFFGARGAGKIRKRLKKVLDLCGEVRNHDIVLELLREARFANDSLLGDLHSSRQRREKELARRLMRKGLRRRLKNWGGRLRGGRTSAGDLWDAEAPVFENAKRVLPGMAADFLETGARAAAPGANHHSMHQFRLLAKRLRYTLEIFAPIYPDGLKPALTALRGLQDRLGAINDCVTSRQLTPRNSNADRAIRNLIPAREASFRAYWEREFPSTAAATWQGWLSSAATPPAEGTVHEHLHLKTRGSRTRQRHTARRATAADSAR